jgi:hypothetical protein
MPSNELRHMQSILENANFDTAVLATTGKAFDLEQLA